VHVAVDSIDRSPKNLLPRGTELFLRRAFLRTSHPRPKAGLVPERIRRSTTLSDIRTDREILTNSICRFQTQLRIVAALTPNLSAASSTVNIFAMHAPVLLSVAGYYGTLCFTVNV
jgi:hypothetical protein